jgi:hypothetical protein
MKQECYPHDLDFGVLSSLCFVGYLTTLSVARQCSVEWLDDKSEGMWKEDVVA